MTRYPVVADGVEWAVLDGDVLAFDGEEELVLLAGPAAEIWGAVSGEASEVSVADAVALRHPAAPGLRDDVRSFLATLVGRGLLRWAEHPCGRAYVVPAHVAWTTDDGLVVLADLRTGSRQALSASGSRVWALVVDGLSGPTLVQRLAAEIEDPPSTLAAEVVELLDLLVEARLLKHRGAPPRAVG